MQTDRQALPSDETAWFYDHLLADIDLNASVSARARAVIAECVAELRAPRGPLPGKWDRWDEQMARSAIRDRALSELLPEEVRPVFERNASAVRAHFDALRAKASAG